jgi:hypothetical protein
MRGLPVKTSTPAISPCRLHRQITISSTYYTTQLFFSAINMHKSKLAFDQGFWFSFGAGTDQYHDS